MPKEVDPIEQALNGHFDKMAPSIYREVAENQTGALVILGIEHLRKQGVKQIKLSEFLHRFKGYYPQKISYYVNRVIDAEPKVIICAETSKGKFLKLTGIEFPQGVIQRCLESVGE